MDRNCAQVDRRSNLLAVSLLTIWGTKNFITGAQENFSWPVNCDNSSNRSKTNADEELCSEVGDGVKG